MHLDRAWLFVLLCHVVELLQHSDSQRGKRAQQNELSRKFRRMEYLEGVAEAGFSTPIQKHRP